ncbi:MAG: FMN-binding protein [Lachnospiraceae bacterium]|nr:FMN-binding protein [Lachnospiraceae bacterium]
MKKKIRVLLIVAASVVILFVVLIAVMFGVMNKMNKEVLDKQVNTEIDMEQVADGTYTGSSDGGLVKVEVEVEVKDHKIVNINLLKHECGTGKPAESMLEEMVKKNTDDVDYVSGATASSRTIRNAVNQALQSGVEGF